MNDDRKFIGAKNQLIQLLIIGMPSAIISLYLEICSSTYSKYLKKLKETGEWNQEPILFRESIKNVVKTLMLIKQKKIVLKEEIDPQRLQIIIEEALGFEKIMEILKISINSIYKLTFSEFAPEVPDEYKNFIRAIFRERDKISCLEEGQERFLLFHYLVEEKDFQIGDKMSTWFYPLVSDIISEYARDLRGLINPKFEINIVERVDYIISTLSEKEAEILKRYYGLGFKKLSIEEIANERRLTPERTRQIKEKALRICRFNRRKFLFTSPPPPVLKSEPKTYLPIEFLKLSVRAFNCLKVAGINNTEELGQYSISDLLKIRNMGKLSVEDIIASLKNHNLKLKSNL
ncbi:MAG: DNA-directed RNA polymerase subunit alpha C-terminal domain-containing protein [Patescibacteria group bacterium]|jgi:hypothetical protein